MNFAAIGMYGLKRQSGFEKKSACISGYLRRRFASHPTGEADETERETSFTISFLWCVYVLLSWYPEPQVERFALFFFCFVFCFQLSYRLDGRLHLLCDLPSGELTFHGRNLIQVNWSSQNTTRWVASPPLSPPRRCSIKVIGSELLRWDSTWWTPCSRASRLSLAPENNGVFLMRGTFVKKKSDFMIAR